jgi:capsular polysaccharide biosynthesis protein
MIEAVVSYCVTFFLGVVVGVGIAVLIAALTTRDL